MTITSSGALTINVQKDTKLSGSQSVTVSGSQSVSIKSDADLSIEGQTSVTIKCGGSQIQISPSGVTVSGPMISLG
jgi:type VI secretion system secreted protein VgrG